jgi:hypothetical protein
MKLSSLLQKITPLPWPVEQFRPTECDSIYRTHAANQLPELLKACKSFLEQPYILDHHCKEESCKIRRLKAAIESAEEVKVTT